jgi:uncharacterized protein
VRVVSADWSGCSRADWERFDDRSAGVALYVVLGAPTERWAGTAEDELALTIRRHMVWMLDLERTGALFAGGPLDVRVDAWADSGLYVLRSGSLADAAALAARDPLVVAGLRTPSVRSWTVNQGCLSLTVRLFDHSARLD